MYKSKVALIRCETYEPEKVKSAIKKGLNLLGGIEKFIFPEQTVLLKPNLVLAQPVEKAITTHPAVFQAVAELCQETGAIVTCGDSPGIARPKTAMQKSGLWEIVQKLNLKLADFEKGEDIAFSEGKLARQFTIANGVLAADSFISLPKLKTHGLTRISGAIKNNYGCIPGVLKAQLHLKFPDSENFSKMLVDLNRFLKPTLSIMDGIIAMEGEGPTSGVPRPISVILISDDPVALDATVGRFFGIKPEDVPPTFWGGEFGLGTYREDEIELIGDDFASFIDPEFDINRGRLTQRFHSYSEIFKNIVVAKPVITESQCTRCGTCVRICPAQPKAVDFGERKNGAPPQYNYNACIRCYCCQELCPEHAIKLKTPWLGKILNRFF